MTNKVSLTYDQLLDCINADAEITLLCELYTLIPLAAQVSSTVCIIGYSRSQTSLSLFLLLTTVSLLLMLRLQQLLAHPSTT